MQVAANPAGIMAARRGGDAEARGNSVAVRSFGVVLRDLLIERGYTTAIGNPNWMQFSEDLGDVQYESLRKAVTGERPPSLRIMERVAKVLGIKPSVFWEYSLAEVQRCFDPREVGADEAYRNLQLWLEAQNSKR